MGSVVNKHSKDVQNASQYGIVQDNAKLETGRSIKLSVMQGQNK